MKYIFPNVPQLPPAPDNVVYLVANGDLRKSANVVCWPTQKDFEERLTTLLESLGYTVIRAHVYDTDQGHGFISTQGQGVDVFKTIPKNAKLIVLETVWQYSHHLLQGLLQHEGPILLAANFDGTWPGLVGMLNLAGTLDTYGKKYSRIWSSDFRSERFTRLLTKWLESGSIEYSTDHVADFTMDGIPEDERKLGQALAARWRYDSPIMGLFDADCMGMRNAIVENQMAASLGFCKESLSQSALYAATMGRADPACLNATAEDGAAFLGWLEGAGMNFEFGPDPAQHLTREQVMLQGRMYAAAIRIAAFFKCFAIGIQYQQGLKDLLPASDAAEGTMNSTRRPKVLDASGRELYAGRPVIHGNEVDQENLLDQMMWDYVARAMSQPVASTLHDVRWGAPWEDKFLWVFEISGSVPADHLKGGWSGALGKRQPPMYFPLGGSTLAGTVLAGPFLWSRIWIDGSVPGGEPHMDIGLGKTHDLPEEETLRRLDATTNVWPIAHAETFGVDRDKMMARQKANHAAFRFARNPEEARAAAYVTAAMAMSLGMKVHFLGTDHEGRNLAVSA